LHLQRGDRCRCQLVSCGGRLKRCTRPRCTSSTTTTQKHTTTHRDQVVGDFLDCIDAFFERHRGHVAVEKNTGRGQHEDQEDGDQGQVVRDLMRALTRAMHSRCDDDCCCGLANTQSCSDVHASQTTEYKGSSTVQCVGGAGMCRCHCGPDKRSKDASAPSLRDVDQSEPHAVRLHSLRRLQGSTFSAKTIGYSYTIGTRPCCSIPLGSIACGPARLTASPFLGIDAAASVVPDIHVALTIRDHLVLHEQLHSILVG
jgi:hypothetical protein